MEKWKVEQLLIKLGYQDWCAHNDRDFLNADGKVCRGAISFLTKEGAEKAIENYERNQKMTSPVDWSQPLQTDEKPARKARLICDDRADKGEDYNYVVLVENRIGKEVVWYCNKHGLVSQTSIRIVNAPAKVPYGREDWERLSRVRLAAQGYQHMSVPVGCIDNLGVRIGERTLLFENAAKEFITMDGKELYK